jgi:hypothetical protein
VAVQQGGKNTSQALSSVKFNVGDVLVLQASDESPLLVRPPDNFYEKDKRDAGDSNNRQSHRSSLANLVTHRFGSNNFADVKDADGSAHENAVALEDAMDAGFFVGDDSEPPSDSSGGIDPEEQVSSSRQTVMWSSPFVANSNAHICGVRWLTWLTWIRKRQKMSGETFE